MDNILPPFYLQVCLPEPEQEDLDFPIQRRTLQDLDFPYYEDYATLNFSHSINEFIFKERLETGLILFIYNLRYIMYSIQLKGED